MLVTGAIVDACVVCVFESESLGARITHVLERLMADSGQTGVAMLRPRWHASLEDAAQDIHSIFHAAESVAVVLVSDLLVEDGEPTSATRDHGRA